MTSSTIKLRSALAVFALCVAVSMAVAGFAPAPAHAAFSPALVVSNDNFRHYSSMSEAEIQKFLETQPGPLKSLRTKDYAGVERRASAIIWRACQQWKISPKVMLTMLQKEQSLLTRTTLAKNTLSRAIGAGCPNATTNRYPGFGNQMWHGARLLDAYGEGKTQVVLGKTYTSTIPLYFPGILKLIYKPDITGDWLTVKTSTVDGETVKKYYITPRNRSTYKLYVYNPSVSGNTNFYNIYKRYFGSPFASPRWQPVYRFRKFNGTYIYTKSVAERIKLMSAPSSRYWEYKGKSFSVDNSATASAPLYRFFNKTKRTYSFTTSKRLYEERRTTAGRKTWSYQGVAFKVSKSKSTGAVPVRRYKNRSTGARWLTASTKVPVYYKTDPAFRRKWVYEGVVFYLPRWQSQ